MLWPRNVVNTTLPVSESKIAGLIQKLSFGHNTLFWLSVWSLRATRAKSEELKLLWPLLNWPAFLSWRLCSALTLLILCAPAARAEMAHEMVSRIVTAIYHAEGGPKAKKPYGILSVPCTSAVDCRRVCENTVRNNYRRWLATDKSKTYLEFLANRYAPVSAHPLNKNWLKNVQHFIYGGAA